MRFTISATLCLAGLAWQALADDAATCPVTVTGSAPAPLVAPGYTSRLIATGLSSPRSIIFDSAGHLLVVQQNNGVVALTLTDNGGSCVSVATKKTVISDSSLNHGIELSPDNKILYVSSVESVFQYAYNPTTATVSGAGKVIINNMTNNDHVTRTLTLSKKQPGTLIVARGSDSNIDLGSLDINSGRAQVRSFKVVPAPSAPISYVKGRVLGWGMRNDVGVAEHPVTGGIWTVENSSDNLERDGVDIHENNPGEELNYLGTLANTSSNGFNYGYPNCLTAWDPSAVPRYPGLQRGQQFSRDPATESATDVYCKSVPVAPRLTFAAHGAPLDIKFAPDGNSALVTFHGSFDRTVPKGYQVLHVAFKNGQPVQPSTSPHGGHPIVRNTGFKNCNPSTCFRPVGLALYTKNRWIFTSDATGELYIIATSSSTSAASRSIGR